MAELEISGSADGVSAVSGAMNIGLLMAGLSDGLASVSGGMNIGLIAVGSTAGVSTVAGAFMIRFGVSGSAAVVSSVSGGMNIAKVMAGSSSGVSIVSGNVEEGLSITFDYVGTQELGMESPQGSKFDIIILGTFSALNITINNKTLTYADSVVDQTIVIDNINMTVKKDGVNALEYLSGDIDSFLKFVPGGNLITIAKTGGDCSVIFDFRPMWL